MQRYDAQNSYVTLGNQLLFANQMLQQLMVSESTMDRIESIEELIGLLEGMLSPYYPFMSLNYYDERQMKMVKFDSYEKAMKHLSQQLKENRKYVDDKLTRHQYVYWLNRKYQLLSSCYGRLKLVPELSGGNDMGAVEDQIPDEVSEMPPSTQRDYENTDELAEERYDEPEPIKPKSLPQRNMNNPVLQRKIVPQPVMESYDETDFSLEDDPTE